MFAGFQGADDATLPLGRHGGERRGWWSPVHTTLRAAQPGEGATLNYTETELRRAGWPARAGCART